MSFEKSKLYHEAKNQYVQDTYKELLNPINIIREGASADTVYLFYAPENIDAIYEIFRKFYEVTEEEYEGDPELTIHLGYNLPCRVDYEFMGNKYKAIQLWYDACPDQIPTEFIK